MTKEQWNIVEAHFDELVDRPASERVARVAAIGDEEIRREVCSLLQHAAGAGTITRAVDLVATDVEAESIRSQRLGPYRLVRRLGQGG